VYSETASGAKTDRERLDRLAQSTRDLLNTLDEISKRGAGFKSLADVWADTTTPHARLMLIVLGVLDRLRADGVDPAPAASSAPDLPSLETAP
jgi:hypothetical protein